ncbi:MAG: glycosyltransferase family 2 protein [Chloroflexi bacterium]|nr:glycosyltransferase family 2 protein [Chloroflexota bacterium]
MISVVMPVYNGEATVGAAIESILTQTFATFEFIIVDDGSDDSTLKIIDEYARHDSRIRIIHNHHGGVSRALNAGLQAAAHDWVAIMHSDDIAMPARLERQWEMSQTDPEVVIWGCNGFHINSRGEVISNFRVGPSSKEECRLLRADGKIVQAIHPTVMLNREVALKVGGYNPDFNVCEDIELFDRMLAHGDLVTIQEELFCYRVHGGSLSMTKYMSQGMITRYVMERQRYRLDTGGELAYDQFLKNARRQSIFVRFRHRFADLTGLLYRRAGLAYSNKQYVQWLIYIGMSTLIRPSYVFGRAWQQVLSPQSRRAVNSQRFTQRTGKA